MIFIGASVLPSISGDIGIMRKQRIEEVQTNPLSTNQGLIAYWNFDEGNGTTAHDYSGNGYDGTIHGATWTTGYSSFALNFNGADSYVNLDPHSVNLGLNKTDDYIISAYINTTTENAGTIYAMSYPDGITVYASLELNANGSILFRTGTTACLIFALSQEGFNDGQWHYIEAKFYGNTGNPTVELYVDDELEDNRTNWLCPITNADFKRAKIGRSSNNETNYFNGKIDEVKIFKYPKIVNHPPKAPIINGTTSGKTGTEYDYTVNSTDPDGDKVYYLIDWGDNTSKDWFGPFDSGDPQTVSHAWDEDGTYTINARAKDTKGALSIWGLLEVTMPRNKPFDFNLLEWLFERFPNALPILRRLVEL